VTTVGAKRAAPRSGAGSGRRRGPRPGTAEDTRGAIAAAARGEFAERGFGGATIRSIAARAHVDPALVHHYFGTKMDLFREVLALDVDPVRTVLPTFLDGPREEAGERIARGFLTAYEDPAFREPVLALMRSAMTDPELARLAGSFLQEALLPAVTGLGLGPERERHVALAMVHLMGTVLGRHLIGLAVLQGPVDELVAELAPVVQRYLDGTNRG
jgi:AcrR family transcriptional regulator